MLVGGKFLFQFPSGSAVALATLAWLVTLALTWYWLWSVAVSKALAKAVAFSCLLVVAAAMSFALQNNTLAGQWTRWGMLVCYGIAIRIVSGGADEIRSRRRMRSIDERR
ncbi:hypothetical protein EIB18_10950 [Caulobacter vibrioides]|uniref:Uncharacterized protein n=1 Tax=Caulobacter vibrioides (strain NA1000 / CB15N) TaxID=565050 RepID=A0A0H3C8C1_CAUVN|nr:hypothetical protein [Caulobacter vibrioides]YP_002517520.1 hypothetical protein CCNA_02147 [Caulobacter vibrioides NA1000]ACL95612.1 hypothetical protein CCNA_02147 [Caulobacter vibrioides NA1000]ATC28937.1 hypothetical protein CA607_11275 [Caulobacter vibrioides]AZH13178.1 hypothetical protein EIB18_10950 [Caulobacter vibrioides]QXZ50450.1 hypothetical protein KZH45_11030 [Caulobacter vibrioides]